MELDLALDFAQIAHGDAIGQVLSGRFGDALENSLGQLRAELVHHGVTDRRSTGCALLGADVGALLTPAEQRRFPARRIVDVELPAAIVRFATDVAIELARSGEPAVDLGESGRRANVGHGDAPRPWL
ncbi:MAG: hypothetical protein AAF637_01490 [Pseudomonadota bacterium]